MENTQVRHVLVVRFSPAMTASQFNQFINAFRDLTHKIEGILSFEYGENISSEGLNQDMTHALILTFVNAAARDAYLPHPAHKQFGELLRELGIVEALLVIDYIPKQ
jgi:quinol monooxygenase YgiN